MTGASRGIGRAIAKALADKGAKLTLMGRSQAPLEALAEELGDAQDVQIITGDVSRYADVERAVRQAIEVYGILDTLINNAGVIDPISRLERSDPQAWAYTLDVNVKGVYNGLRAALPRMIEAHGGTIINMSSGAANSALEGWSHYCAGKAAAKKLT